jgi:hypothetical protein
VLYVEIEAEHHGLPEFFRSCHSRVVEGGRALRVWI